MLILVSGQEIRKTCLEIVETRLETQEVRIEMQGAVKYLHLTGTVFKFSSFLRKRLV